MLSRVFLAIGCKVSAPLCLELCATLAKLGIEVVCCLRDLESLIGGKIELDLEGSNIIGLERCNLKLGQNQVSTIFIRTGSVNSTGALLLGTVTNGSS